MANTRHRVGAARKAAPRTTMLLLVGLALSGCANQVTLASRDGGPGGAGTLSGAMGSRGNLRIQLEGKPYLGQWVVSADGGFSGFSAPGKGAPRPQAFASANIAKATGIVTAGYAGNGDGRAVASAADGQTLRCSFHLNTVTSVASGLCERNDGRLYDLTIKQ